MTMRIRLGLGGGSSPYDSLGAGDVDTLANRALALRCAEKSLVLVKNDRGVLPLDRRKLRRICVTGPRALDEVALYGNYYGIASHAVPVLSGVAKSAGVEVQVNDIECSDDADHPLDAVVVCIGLTAEMEGEQGSPNAKSDRVGTALPESDIALLRNIRKTVGALPVVAVVFGGSPLDLGPVAKQCDAILFAWYPGEEGGTAVANALFGDVNPSGKLPCTWPYSYADTGVARLGEFTPKHSIYNERFYVGYRWFDAMGIKPMFPFGYGLSYTAFEYKRLKASREDGGFEVSVKVENAGSVAGKESVQLYATYPDTGVERCVAELKAFAKTGLLEPGDDEKLTMFVGYRDLAYWDDVQNRFTTPAGVYKLLVGSSLRDIRGSVDVTVRETMVFDD